MNRLSARVALATLVWLSVPHSAYAALEYLRFEGSIFSSYDPDSLPHLDYEPGQSLFFDVAVDTAVAGSPTCDVPDCFFTELLAGDAPGARFGQTFMFPEGTTSSIVLTNGLDLGIDFFGIPTEPPYDSSIDTWVVGTQVGLFTSGGGDVIFLGSLLLTYRNSTPPAPIPLPAPLWMFLGSLLLVGIRRRQRSIVLNKIR